MERTPSGFKTSSAKNIANSKLRETFHSATRHALEQRLKSIHQVPEWEELREKGHQIKKEVINQLDFYLEQLESNILNNGGQVFCERDADEASNYILKLCRRLNAKNVVKSKSMTTEEIKLASKLEKQGVEPIETDLGEFIIQLANETPSHIIAPALHMTRQQIGALFNKTFNIPYTEIPEELCAFARGKLRQKFLSTKLGISGVNFAAADTGTIVVVENEGNARMCTNLPKVHVAIMGLEKVIPRFEDLSIFLKLLSRSATGQKQTSYVSMINGPRKVEDLDGPEEFHLVILDNGRTEILSNPKLRESLFCIRCGACLNTCPVYQRVGGHSYGSTYSGPIGSVLTPLLQGLDTAKDLPYASSLCGACSNICPVKIDVHHQLLWLREQVVKQHKSSWQERLAMHCYTSIMKDVRLYRLGSFFLRNLLKIFYKKGQHLNVPGWSKDRDFPPIAAKTFKELWKETTQQKTT